MTKDEVIKVRCTEDLKDLLNDASRKRGKSKSELLRSLIRENLEFSRNDEILSLQDKIKENKENIEKYRQELEELKKEQQEVYNVFERIREEIKEFLEPIFKEALRKSEDLKYRKRGLIENDLPNRFGIVWKSQPRALELLKRCSPLDHTEIDSEIEEFLDAVEEERMIHEISREDY